MIVQQISIETPAADIFFPHFDRYRAGFDFSAGKVDKSYFSVKSHFTCSPLWLFLLLLRSACYLFPKQVRESWGSYLPCARTVAIRIRISGMQRSQPQQGRRPVPTLEGP